MGVHGGPEADLTLGTCEADDYIPVPSRQTEHSRKRIAYTTGLSTPLLKGLAPRKQLFFDPTPRVCHDVKRVSRFETVLNDLDTHEVLVYNMEVQNQERLKCFQCAGFMIDGCHCHIFECAVCNPEHFCPVCGELEYI